MLCGILKKRAHAQIAHLVFADPKSQTLKNQKSYFLANAREEMTEEKVILKMN
jgi:hypothetical protein